MSDKITTLKDEFAKHYPKHLTEDIDKMYRKLKTDDKIFKFVVGAGLGLLLLGPLGLGAAIGGLGTGLTGAAAASHGVALLGGGALAAGGGGILAGQIVSMTTAGLLGSSINNEDEIYQDAIKKVMGSPPYNTRYQDQYLYHDDKICYDGEIVGHLPDGMGTLYDTDGSVIHKGLFMNGNPVSSL